MSRLSEQKHPAYHLRPNKAVDRFVFLELLRTLELRIPLHEHVYVGLGGPFLEDFRLLSHQFPRMQLVCVEQDEETHKRQLFHTCSRRMECTRSSLADFVAASFPTDRRVIVWADYTDATRECLAEVGDIVRKASPGSIVRVTVRAESPVPGKLRLRRYSPYPSAPPSGESSTFDEIRRSFSDDMALDGIAFPADWFAWAQFRPDLFPRLLSRMLNAVGQGSCTHPKAFLPLHSVKYSDGTIMLSFTGLVCSADDRASYAQHFADHCEFYSGDADEVQEIDVPSLTTKERLHLDGVLPSLDASGDACVERLGYLIEGDASEEESKRKMEQFQKYYRLYPYFGKVVP